MGLCAYRLCIDTDNKEIRVVAPEGMQIYTETATDPADTVQSLIERVAPVIDEDINNYGCDAPWSCAV